MKAFNNSNMYHREGRRYTTPRLCSLCSRPAFLQCIECETIYCSSICQVEDWENHRRQDKHINRVAQRNNPTKRFINQQPPSRGSSPVNLQNRLKMAAMKEAAIPYKPQQQQHVTEIDAPMNELDLNDTADNTEAQKLIDYSNSSSSDEEEEPKAETPAAAPPSDMYKIYRKLEATPDGFARVTVTNIGLEPEPFYYLVPTSCLSEFQTYRFALNNTYNGDSIKRIDPKELINAVPKFFLAKFGNYWVRCVCAIAEESSILAIDIDSGIQKTLNIQQDEIKLPLAREYETQLYCIKAELTNVGSEDNIAVGDVIEIKVLTTLENGALSVEVKYDNDDEEDDSESDVDDNLIEASVAKTAENVEQKNDEQAQEDVGEPRFTPKDTKLKVLMPGKVMLTLVDGSKIAEGTISVYKALPENHAFIQKMEDDIEEYIKANPNAGNYRPIQYELVLAKFTDGKYYRGMCKNIAESGEGCNITFLEYCNTACVEFKNIVKLPLRLLHECISRNISIQLESGRSIDDVDAKATADKFYDEIEEFEVELLGDGKTAVINDSLFIFKN